MEKKSLLARLKDKVSGPSGPDAETNDQELPTPRSNTWAVSGRTAQMQIRTLMQLKAFGRMR